MAEPTDLPIWDENDTNTIPISTELQDDGFSLRSKQASGTFNSWFRNVYKWTEWFQEKFSLVDAEIDKLAPVDTIADLRAITYTPEDGQTLSVLGYYASTENREWRFQWDSTSTEDDNGGTIIKVATISTGRFEKLIKNDTVDVKEYGAKGDGITDDSIACQEALDNHKSVIFSEGNFLITSPLGYYSAQMIRGLGRSTTTITLSGFTTGEAAFYPINSATAQTNRVQISDFSITGESVAGVIGINILRVQRGRFVNIRINNIGGTGYNIDGTNNGTVQEGHYNYLEQCQTTGIQEYGFKLTGGGPSGSETQTNRNTLIACRVNGASEWAYWLGEWTNTNSFYSCHAENSENHLYVNAAHNNFHGMISETITTNGLFFDTLGRRNIATGRFGNGAPVDTMIVDNGGLNNIIDTQDQTYEKNTMRLPYTPTSMVKWDGDVADSVLHETITGITQATPAVVTITGTLPTADDIMYIEDVVGMTQINNKVYMIKNPTGSTVELYSEDGLTPIDSTGYTAYASAGTLSGECTIESAYNVDHVFKRGVGQYRIWFETSANNDTYLTNAFGMGLARGFLSGTGTYTEYFVGVVFRDKDDTLMDTEVGCAVMHRQYYSIP